MSRFLLYFSVLFCSALCLLTSIAVRADETTTVVTPVATPEGAGEQTTTTTVKNDGSTVTRQTIVTNTPTPKEVVATPAGYASCYKVEAGWYNQIWVPEHQVCKYTSSAEGVAWVEGYWACTQYTGVNCTNWDWKPGHWVKTLVNY